MPDLILKRLLPFYSVRMVKSPFYICTLLLFPFCMAMKILVDLQEDYVYMDYSGLLNGVVIPIQGMMLLISVYLYRTVSDEIHYRHSILLPKIVQIQYQRIIALLLNHAAFLIMTISTGLIMLLIYFQIQRIPWSDFQISLLRHALTFYFLPLFLAALWGINCALLFGKRKSGLLGLFLVWILIGPLNTEFFSDYFYAGGLSDIRSLFFIGPLQPGSIYAQLTGFIENDALLLKNGLHILFQCILSLFLIGRWQSRTAKRMMTTVSSFILCSLLLTLSPFALANDQLVFDRSFDNQLSARHIQSPADHFSNQDLDFTIQKIHLNITRQTHYLLADATLLIHSRDTTSTRLSLWREYPVQYVEVDNRRVPFERQGDFLSFKTNALTSTQSVRIGYQIKNSAFFPITSDTWYLPASLNWYPVRQADPINRVGVETLDLIRDRQAVVDVTIEGDLPSDFVTNLTKTGRTLTGRVAGVTLMRGGLQVYRQKDKQLITDSSWSEPDNYWSPVYKTLLQVDRIVARRFHKESVFPDKIILLSPNLERDSYRDDAHLLLQVGTTLRIDKAIDEVISVYIPSILWSNASGDIQTHPKWRVFNAALANWVQTEMDMEASDIDPFFLQQSNLEMDQIEQWIKDYTDLDHEKQLKLLKTWYVELSHSASIH